jgi:hypothetical protein
MPAHPRRHSLHTWQPRPANPVFLHQQNMAITGQKTHKSIAAASDIATENDMIKMST